MNSLLVVDKHGRPMDASRFYTKADPPKLGEAYGAGWATAGKPTYQLPGGGVLIFDLDRLTLQDFRAMTSHYQINISVSLLSFMVHQVPWTIEGTEEKPRKFVEENLREVWSRLIRAIRSAYWAGYAPTILQYENDANARKIRLEKVKDIEPEKARPHWKEVEGAAPPNGGVRPKIRIYDGMDIHGHAGPIPAENTMWYPLLMEAGDHFGRKLLKPAFPAWFFSQIIHLYVNRYFERFGEPVPIGRAPFERDIDLGNGTTISGKLAMEQILESFRNRATVTLPNDRYIGSTGQGGKGDFEWQIEYLESQMRGADFERYLGRLDEEMSLGIFTPILLYRTSDVGSYNLGEAHMQIFLVMVNSLIGDLAEYINRYIIRRLIDFNFGPNAGRDVRFVPKKMGEAPQATYRQILQAMIQGGFAKVNVEDLGLQVGLRIEEVEQVIDQTQNPADPNQDPASSDGQTDSGASRSDAPSSAE